MKKILALVLSILMLAGAAAAVFSADVSPFTDVKTSRWSYDSIKYAVEKGYMNGIGDGKFDPAGSMTRGMVVTVLYRREGSPAVTFRDDFTDVKSGKYYSDAVIWAKDERVVNGITETTFEPNGKITREQLATMLSRFSERCLVSVPERADLSGYPDADKIHSYAKDALAWANEANLIKGMDDGTLSPRGNATREQFATILKRFDDTFTLAYNEPVLKSHYTEPEYPLIDNADIYVAVDGNDSNPGTFEAPLATFAGAAAKVRGIKQTKTSGDIVVAFKAGDYGPLSLALTAEDSGTPEQRIIYCKYGDGDVVFNNGFDFPAESFEPISGSEKALFSGEETDNIRKIDMSTAVAAGLDLSNVILYSGHGLCDEARYPNRNEDGSDNLCFAGAYVAPDTMKIIFPPLARRIAKYGPEVFNTMKIWGYIRAGYCKDLFVVTGFDSETNYLKISECLTNPQFNYNLRDWMGVSGQGMEICVTNVSLELDCEGEYWIDPATETLYMYKPDGDYFIPFGDTMITMDGADDLTMRGLTFKNCAGSFIDAWMCHGATLELCTFRNTSAVRGVSFTDNSLERAMELTVKECTFENSYGHALYVSGNNVGEHRFDKRENVVFDNNLVRTTNMIYDNWNGIRFYECAGVSVTHNRFEDCSRGAVSFTQCYDVLVEYNDFDSVMCDSHDGGVIYTDWICDARDLVVRYNYFGRVPSSGAGQYGLYLDEFSSGFEIYSNLFYQTGSSDVMFSLGRDNVFSNNVCIILEEFCGVLWWGTSTREQIDEAGSYEAARPTAWGIYHGEPIWGELFYNLENYPAYRAVVEEKWPEMLKIHFDPERIDDRYFALNQTTVADHNVIIDRMLRVPSTVGVTGWVRIYEGFYSEFEGNRAYLPEENPLFVNPTLGDYRIREGADFPDIEFEKIGRY